MPNCCDNLLNSFILNDMGNDRNLRSNYKSASVKCRECNIVVRTKTKVALLVIHVMLGFMVAASNYPLLKWTGLDLDPTACGCAMDV